MGFLAGLTGLSAKVIQNRPWTNPGLDAALDRLPSLPPEAAIEFVLAYLAPIRNDIEAHVQANTAFGEQLTGHLDVLRRRAAAPAERDDPGTAADLLALLGTTLIARAWEVRGSGSGSSVAGSAYRQFVDLLKEADDVLLAATRTALHHPAGAAGRMWTAIGLGMHPGEASHRLAEAGRLRGTLFPAHWAMTTFLCRKWHGTDEQMFTFAQQVAAQAPAGDPVVAMLPLAHAEYLVSLAMAPPRAGGGFAADSLTSRARKADLETVLVASRSWVGDGTGPIPDHARNVEAHQLFGWYFAVVGGQRDLARWHLERAHRRMNHAPWAYIPPSPVAAFRAAHARLGIG